MFLIEEMATPTIKYLATGSGPITSITNTGSLGEGIGNVNNMTVPSLFAGPTATLVNGKTMLQFSQGGATKQRLQTIGLTASLTGNKTYFLVAKYNSTSAKGRIFTSLYNGTADNWLLGHHGGKSCVAYTSTITNTYLNGVEANSVYNVIPFQESLYIYCLTQDTSTLTTKLFVQGNGSTFIRKGSWTEAQTIPTNLLIGGTGMLGVTTEISDCYFGEARVYDGVLSDTAIQTIMTELKTYWNPDALAPPTILTPTGTVTIASREYNGTTTINPSQITSSLSLVGVTGIDPTKPVTIDSVTAVYPDKNAGTGNPVSVMVNLSDNDNYSVESFIVTANITPASTTVIVTADNKVYNGNSDATLGSTTLSTNYDGVGLVASVSDLTFSDENAAVGKLVTGTVTLSGTAAWNYMLSGSTFNPANITAATLTVSGVTANNKPFDGTTVATTTGTLSLTGVVGSEMITASVLSANFNTPNIENNKPVTVVFTISGTTSGNYTLANIILTADITAAPTPTPTQARQYLVSPTTDTSASGVTSCIATTSMRQSMGQGMFKPADSQAWIRYKKGLCSR
jgi:uncharacterized protein YaiE (UPF0345 family)